MRKLFLIFFSSLLLFKPIYAQDTMPYSQRMANSQMSRSGTLSNWDYPNGLFAESVLKVYGLYPEAKYLTYVENHAKATINSSSGQINGYKMSDYNIDNINPGMFLIRLEEISSKPQYRKAMDILRQQIENQPRINNTADGGFWHKKRYPHQMWLDGLYMGARYYAEYEKKYNDGAGWDDVVNQFVQIHSHTYDPEYQLNYHGWSAKPEDANSFWANKTEPFSGCSNEFWARGLGWYTAALIDVIEILPDTFERRNELIEIFGQVTAGIKRWQDAESGCWFQLLRYDGTFKSKGGHYNYIEASSSSMFTYALLKAVRLGIADSIEFWPVAEKAYKGLLENFITESGSGSLSLNRICRSAGLGPASSPQRDGSADYYLDGSDAGDIVSNDLKGIGPFIMASVEYEMATEKPEETGIQQLKKVENIFRVFAVNGTIMVESEMEPINELKCFDMQGKLLASKKGNFGKRFQFLFDVPGGIYLFLIDNRYSTKVNIN